MYAPTRWADIRDQAISLLESRTRCSLAEWNLRVKATGFEHERDLRAWLNSQGVTGYAAMLLVSERFGDASSISSFPSMIAAQYADRLKLRPVFDRLCDEVSQLDDIIIAIQPTHVSFETSIKQFAVVKPTTREYLDLALQLSGEPFTDRFVSCGCGINSQVTHNVRLTDITDVDQELIDQLRRAHDRGITSTRASSPVSKSPVSNPGKIR